jgi:hypothetical protein
MNSATILHNLSPEDITKQFKRLEELILKIASTEKSNAMIEFVTREEVAKILKCDLSTVHNWTVKGYLKKYYMGGGKILYKLQEVLDAPKFIPSLRKSRK